MSYLSEELIRAEIDARRADARLERRVRQARLSRRAQRAAQQARVALARAL